MFSRIYNILKQINSFDKILPAIAVLLTNTERYKPDLIVYPSLYVSKIFRFYEQIFWRRNGIKPETAITVYKDKQGKVCYKYEFYTVEAILTHAEVTLRKLLKIKLGLVELPQLQYAHLNNFFHSFNIPIVSFAIAYDASSNRQQVSPGTSLSFSFTVSGSNTAVINNFVVVASSDTVTSVTVGGNSATKLHERAADAGVRINQYGRIASSGSNTVVINVSSSTTIVARAVSYSGVDQTTPFPDTAVGNGATSTTSNATITPTVTGSWTVMTVRSPNNISASTNSTARGTGNPDDLVVFDSNGTVSTGSGFTMNGTQTSATWGAIITTIAPASSSSAIYHRLPLLGVG